MRLLAYAGMRHCKHLLPAYSTGPWLIVAPQDRLGWVCKAQWSRFPILGFVLFGGGLIHDTYRISLDSLAYRIPGV